jgi:hypothetical protein
MRPLVLSITAKILSVVDKNAIIALSLVYWEVMFSLGLS